MRPNHYSGGDLEPLKIIQDHNLPFELGNALKYIARCNHKGNKREDLEKAIDYLQRFGSRPKWPDSFELEKEWQISDDLSTAVICLLARQPDMAIRLIQQELENE